MTPTQTPPEDEAEVLKEEQEAEAAAMPSQNPRIYLTDYLVTLSVGASWNPLDYVSEITDDADDTFALWRKIQVADEVNTSAAGTYECTYYVIDSQGNIPITQPFEWLWNNYCTGSENMRINRRRDRLPGTIITLILFLAVLAFTVLLLYTNLIPMKYIGIIFLGLLILVLLIHLLVLKFRKKVRFWIGVVLSVILLLILGGVSFYIHKTVSSLDTITGVNKDTVEVGVYVMQDDPAQTMHDAAGYSFGILSELDRGNTDAALEQIYFETGSEISPTEYNSLTELADGITSGDCQAVIMNSGYLAVLDQMDGYSSFSSQIRNIASYRIESVVERKEPETTVTPENDSVASDEDTADDAVTDEVYTIYISGIDTRGGMTASSLSDVNILLTVNTRTRQVLMVSTPRDYYVPLSISNGVPDKLTHAEFTV